jgi:hypothetical protein
MPSTLSKILLSLSIKYFTRSSLMCCWTHAYSNWVDIGIALPHGSTRHYSGVWEIDQLWGLLSETCLVMCMAQLQAMCQSKSGQAKVTAWPWLWSDLGLSIVTCTHHLYGIYNMVPITVLAAAWLLGNCNQLVDIHHPYWTVFRWLYRAVIWMLWK